MKHLSDSQKTLLKADQTLEQVKANLLYLYENDMGKFLSIGLLIRDSYIEGKIPNLTPEEERIILEFTFYGACAIAGNAIGRKV